MAEGKAVVVDMGAQWCGPCKGAAPYMQELYETYGENQTDVIFLGMLLQNTAGAASTCGTIEEWDAELGLSYPTVPANANGTWNGDGMNLIMSTYDVTGIPFFITFVPDPENPGQAMVAYNDNDTTEANFFVGIQNALTSNGFPEGGVSLGNEEYNVSSIFSVYPNPAQDVLNIETSSDIQIESMTISSIRGNVIKTFNTKVKSIQISDLTSGIYFIEIKHNDGVQKVKFIKS